MSEKKILVVDYDQASLESLTRVLKDLKVQIIQATDGAQAYDLFKEEKPDLVILEAILPKLHGFDLTKKITQESKGSVPVIIITALYKGPQYKHEAMTNLGASEYLEKPVNPEVLLEAVNRLLTAEEDIEDVLPDLETVIALVNTRGR
ncbi:MAG: response regulator [Candidatus Saccharicenans sp.]|jgi:DNA-binding response OmpR family regulator|nr:response regulator [Candidatus Saccharicenans sp.]NMC66085.1 response regulator [Acidobacteriota bacterium]HAV42130.1 response regulator [Acidobacteriota bacterium]